MSSDLLWSILIATLASRRGKFEKLMDVLLPQAENEGSIEVVACHNNGERPLGEIRQGLMMTAKGKYLSFIDDDDMISDTFAEDLLKAMRQGPDVVGFHMKYYESGQFVAPSYHSIKYEAHNTTGAFFRDLTHQMPVKSELARQGDFRVAWPEDSAWKYQVRPLLKTEVYVDKCLYHYFHDWADTVQGTLRPHTYESRPEIYSPVFRWLEVNDIIL